MVAQWPGPKREYRGRMPGPVGWRVGQLDMFSGSTIPPEKVHLLPPGFWEKLAELEERDTRLGCLGPGFPILPPESFERWEYHGDEAFFLQMGNQLNWAGKVDSYPLSRVQYPHWLPFEEILPSMASAYLSRYESHIRFRERWYERHAVYFRLLVTRPDDWAVWQRFRLAERLSKNGGVPLMLAAIIVRLGLLAGVEESMSTYVYRQWPRRGKGKQQRYVSLWTLPIAFPAWVVLLTPVFVVLWLLFLR